MAAENEHIVDDEEERTADGDDGKDVLIDPIESRSHAEHEPPGEVCRHVEPYDLNDEQDDLVPMKTHLQVIDERMQAEKENEGHDPPGHADPPEEHGQKNGRRIGEHVPDDEALGKGQHHGEAAHEITRGKQEVVENAQT